MGTINELKVKLDEINSEALNLRDEGKAVELARISVLLTDMKGQYDKIKESICLN